MAFKENLKSLRIEKNLLQKDIANALGYNTRTICSWEKGEREPSLDALKKLKEFFKVDYNELLE